MTKSPSDADGTALTFMYRNWRGEVSRRRVLPIRVYFGATDWHPEPQWLMEATDLDKGEARDFALRDIQFGPATVADLTARLAEAEEAAKTESTDYAADFIFGVLAKALGLAQWDPKDGTETWDGDVAATLYGILRDAGAIDPGTDEPAAKRLAAAEAEVKRLREATIPRDVHEALCDSQYRAGAGAGWNAAMTEDPAEAERRFAELRRIEPGALEPILRRKNARAALSQPPAVAAPPEPARVAASFQDRVQPWMMACFGEAISNDMLERMDRFCEEANELLQSLGYPRERAHALVDYVHDRPAGDPPQEVGGAMVTLAALCLAAGMDMHAAGETELARIWTKVEAIRAKQAAKPTGSALPIAMALPPPHEGRRS